MQYQYVDQGPWGSSQQAPLPLTFGDPFQTEAGQEQPIYPPPTFANHYDNTVNSISNYTAMTTPLFSYAPLNFDVPYVPSDSSNGLQTPVTPRRSFTFPLSVSPQQLHVPRQVQPLEVVLAEEEEIPLVTEYNKIADHSAHNTHYEYSSGSDPDSDSDSNTQYDFPQPKILKVNAESGRTETVSRVQNNLSSVPGPIQIPSLIKSDSADEDPGLSKRTILPVQSPQISHTELEASAVIQPLAIAKTPVLKKTRKSMASKNKKAASGRQILLSKRKKPAAKVKPISQTTLKNSRIERGKKKVVPPPTRPFPLIPFEDRVDEGILTTPSKTTEISCQKPKKASRPRASPKMRKSSTTLKLSADLKSATETEKKEFFKPNSVTLPQRSIKRNVATSKYAESPPLSPASEAVSIPDDRDYQPSPSPLLEELEVSSDLELPISALKIKKRARTRKEDDEAWGMNDKKKKTKKVNQNANGEDETVRIMNKARGKLYHPGRSEQNMRAQSKYRNKVKNRSDLAFDALQELFALDMSQLKLKAIKEKLAAIKHEFGQRLQALDPSFAREKFSHLLESHK